ncbi:MAG: DUF4260 domain-containing protein [Anaerolineae bacterium]|nr:DUF4260 domain-containing protein [Anaerolineae bacterium]
MKNLIRIEELFFVLLCIYLFSTLDYAWWWFPALLLTPDLSMIGYAATPRLGATIYNIFHHRGAAIAVYLIGALLNNPPLQLAGVILLAHASLDRMVGYGLKYPDAFTHTHLETLEAT